MILPKLIGLYSPAPQCGKSTVKGILGEGWGYEGDRFAKTLKDMIRVLLRDIGYTPLDTEAMVEGECKEMPIPVLGGKTTRHLMRTIGTEWGRNCVSETMWPDILLARWRALNRPTVVDDLRFANEYKALRKAGGFLVRIERPGEEYQAKPGHPSDGALEVFDFDYTLVNDQQGEVALAGKIEEMLDAASRWCGRIAVQFPFTSKE